ncbi:hypothetical protein [Paenibacillus crassostreae]|uniref:Uncharacterized protein n=1 Tax=Paenibacillus crassostreae TaxID=1763538 RepID=A0A167G256_9BACL|nr:hypothetical protein [Paenibacillus crassostreae]AOZ93833.1 hypothetical protein LPB68_17705 [Paenibacillus crassostreae]OAB77133.1 hypothetical protein PNBC_07030 [Paenibacillus crassostreae]
MNNTQDNNDNGYLFNIDLLINNQSNAIALQLLIEMINQNDHVIDYRINTGIELGGIINTLLAAKKDLPNTQRKLANTLLQKYNKVNNLGKSSVPTNELKSNNQQPISNTKNSVSSTDPIEDPRSWIRSCIKDNRLVRMTANRLGHHFNIPCRILNFDEERQLINVYHVDEKQVYSFSLNEIDSFTV